MILLLPLITYQTNPSLPPPYRVNEALCRASTGAILDEEEEGGGGKASTTTTTISTTPAATTTSSTSISSLNISNVNFLNVGPKNRKIRCIVEGISVDVSSNDMKGLCMVAFLEEVGVLVGKDFLLKKSLLLLKSWCTYEGRTYEGYSILSYIDENTLEVMLLMVFNLYHSRIHQPLQALALFFHVFSGFDWARSVLVVLVVSVFG